MKLVFYFVSLFLFAAATWVIYRFVVRRDYRRKGQLTLFSGSLEPLIWGLYMGFPYLYNPPEWAWFWSRDVSVGAPLRIVGVVLILGGLVLVFATMLWFGPARAFGRRVDRLVRAGPYRFTRNPQLVGGALLVTGSVALWPSWYALGWVALYGFVAQMMVLAEEEHLGAVYGAEYVRYCAYVPRYLGLPREPQEDRNG